MADKKISELPLITTISGSIVYVPVVHDGITEKITIQDFSKYTSQYSAHTGSAGNTYTGPQTINNNVTITGKLTVNEIVAVYETASIIYSEGGNIFGNELTDIQQLTGSVNVTGSLNYNGVLVTNIDANTIHRLQQTTASLNFFTASQIGKDGTLAEVTSSLRYFYQTTSSIHAFTASQIGKDGTLAEVTSSLRYFYQTTSSLHDFTASQIGKDATLSIFTASINAFTGSLIGITNGLMAFTAALDNTYATDAQLYQLYQATRSIELHSGSMIGVTNGLMAYTASNSTLNTGLRGEVDGIEAYTASLKGQAIVSSSTQVQNYDVFALNSNLYTGTGSLQAQLNGLMAFTASLDNTYATDAQLLPILQATQSLELHSGSMVGITNGIMALTASMKAAAIVSSSTQITNYYKFAETASANTFYGNQKVKGNLDIDNKVSVTGSLIVSSSANQLWATPEFQLYNGLGNVNFALTPNVGNQLQIQAYGTKAEILQANEPLRLLTPTLQMVKYDNTPTKVEVTGSANITGSITITSGSITMPHRPAFRLIGDGGQILAPYTISGSRVVMDYNQGNHYNPTTGLFRAPIAGLYQVNLVVRTATNTNNPINQAIVYKSGSNTGGDVAQIMVEFGINTSMNHAGGSTISYLDAGDTLRAVVAVGTCSFDSNDNFSVAYIG